MSEPKKRPAPAYPVPKPAEGFGDGRFTVGLVFEVADLLARHGYPAIEAGADIVRLAMALYRAIYEPDGELP